MTRHHLFSVASQLAYVWAMLISHLDIAYRVLQSIKSTLEQGIVLSLLALSR